jgi:hypothetical protein
MATPTPDLHVPPYDGFWLRPDGRLYLVGIKEEHDAWAEDYLRLPSNVYGDAREKLLAMGWWRGVRETDAREEVIGVNGERPLTSRQRATLEEVGMENGIPVVAYWPDPEETIYSPPEMAVAEARLPYVPRGFWLTQAGKVYDVGLDDHDLWAADFLDFKRPADSDDPTYGDSSQILLRRGWWRAVLIDEQYIANGDIALTRAQRGVLEEMGLEAGVPVLAYLGAPSWEGGGEPEVVFSPPTEVAEAFGRGKPLEPATVERLRARLTRGMEVWRGFRRPGQKPADPGDLGQGAYHSTSRSRASGYGEPRRVVLRLRNPLILSAGEAYDQVADRFGTISGVAGEPQHGAGDMGARALRSAEATAALVRAGYDGLVAVNPHRYGGLGGEIEIVQFPAVSEEACRLVDALLA